MLFEKNVTGTSPKTDLQEFKKKKQNKRDRDIQKTFGHCTCNVDISTDNLSRLFDKKSTNKNPQEELKIPDIQKPAKGIWSDTNFFLLYIVYYI